MSNTQRDKEEFLTTDQLRVLANPNRQEVLSRLRSAGCATVAEIAHQMGRSPEAMHYHFRQMLSVGLLKEVARRQVPRGIVSVYALSAERFRLRVSADPDYRAAVRQATSASLRFADRAFSKASRAIDRDEALRDFLGITHMNVRLTREQMEHVVEKMGEVTSLIKSYDSRDEGQRCTFVMVVAPLIERATDVQAEEPDEELASDDA